MGMSIMPHPAFYPSPGMAMKAAPEQIAYVALLNVGKNGKRDAMSVIDLEPGSSTYGQLLGQVDFPNGDNELHHFGWGACGQRHALHALHPHIHSPSSPVRYVSWSGPESLDENQSYNHSNQDQ